ncbi:hypothetical protein HanRHA438_Chr02g0056481 [Helianthus annuus]|nr:hypothetical protein HanRHA438_Chr02g0056481 [Helianthus annuus]
MMRILDSIPVISIKCDHFVSCEGSHPDRFVSPFSLSFFCMSLSCRIRSPTNFGSPRNEVDYLGIRGR